MAQDAAQGDEGGKEVQDEQVPASNEDAKQDTDEATPDAVVPADEEKVAPAVHHHVSFGGEREKRHSHVTIDYDDDGTILKEADDVKVRWNMDRTANKPCLCCCQLCGVWAALFFLLVLLGAVVAPISFSLGVPFYDRSDINNQREESYLATARTADYIATYGQSETGECVHTDETILTPNGTLLAGPPPSDSCQRASNTFLRLIYVAKDCTSNVLTEETLRAIQEVEQTLLKEFGLSRYCYLIDAPFPAFENRDREEVLSVIRETAGMEPEYISCERMNSPLNFLDSFYYDLENETGLGYYLMPSNSIRQEYQFSDLPDVIKYWSNFTVRSYDLTNLGFQVPLVGDSLTIRNLFWRVTSSEFRPGSSTAVGLTSTLALGSPIHGYGSASEGVEDQTTDTGLWLWETFDEYLKGVDIEGVDLYWSDSGGGMLEAEMGSLAVQSMLFFPISLLIVLLYLIYMQDSIYLGLSGIGQIMLSFIPTILFYSYVVGEDYLGVLNMIAIYIILGIGVDNLFVFCDQFNHQRMEPRLDVRFQKTFNIAGKAMFTTSCTTFISFISNATSTFPAVSTFGLFAALLVVMNYLAVIIFFPAVYSVYYSRIRKVWWDHPSLLYRCNKEVPRDQYDDDAVREEQPKKDEVVAEDSEQPKQDEEKLAKGESSLVAFFRGTWAPLVIKLRYPIVAFFFVIFVGAVYFTLQLEPDESAPSTLPDDNPYGIYQDMVLNHFARAGNPSAIKVLWVSGIDPDDPIDRAGTDKTNLTDYGTPNFLDCSTFDPTKPESQVWSLKTCHDLFFGNVTEYHDGDESFGPNGMNGPKSRLIVTETVPMADFYYYDKVSCFTQGLRDWMLTDGGCRVLSGLDLPCIDETSKRENCTLWDTDPQNSCEPFPVPEEMYFPVISAFMQDETTDPETQKTNYDKFSEQLFGDDNVDFDDLKIVQDDFSCRTLDGLEGTNNILFAISTTATLDQDFSQSYSDGLDLYEKWDAWSVRMRANAPREMIGTMQTSNGAWGFYFLNETLLDETFKGIYLALGLSFVVLTLIGGNIIMAFFAVLTICLIVLDVFAFTVIVGFSLGVIEAVNYVVVIGMSIDYAVHMSEAYTSAVGDTREERVILMLEEMGVSVLSGALSTLFAIFLMFFAPNKFFVKFATFLFVTIALSCIYAMTFFPALLAIVGPMGKNGQIYSRLADLRKKLVHDFAKDYVQSTEFIKREERVKEKSTEMTT